MNETAIRELISGKTTGLAASVLRAGLWSLSLCYGAGVRARNALFDVGLRRSSVAPVPVVSVGNITAGGTGKTPFVAWLTQWFHARNVRVALLSRGYRALPGEVNDEKLMLDQLCPGVPHLQNPDRVHSASKACREHSSQLLILDDGFQHRRLRRNLDIVLIDALNPWGYDQLLPRGLLREPLTGLRRADIIVLTRADQCDARARDQILARLQRIRGNSDRVEVAFVPEKLVNASGKSLAIGELAGKKIAAFCGIGNPDAFLRTLAQAGINITPDAMRVFPDHHHYTEGDFESLGRSAAEQGAVAVVTTQKDLVKTDRETLAGIPLWSLRISAKILQGEDLLEDRLSAILSGPLK